MLDANVRPNERLFVALIQMYGKAGWTSHVDSTFVRMRQWVRRPSLIAYNALLDALADCRDWETAEMRYYELIDAGYTPDSYTFTALMRVYGWAGRWQEAERAYVHMRDIGVKPDHYTCETLLSTLERNGKWRRSILAFGAMREDGFEPTAVSVNTMMNCLVHAPKTTFAQRCLEMGLQKGLLVLPGLPAEGRAGDTLDLHDLSVGTAKVAFVMWLRRWQQQLEGDFLPPLTATMSSGAYADVSAVLRLANMPFTVEHSGHRKSVTRVLLGEGSDDANFLSDAALEWEHLQPSMPLLFNKPRAPKEPLESRREGEEQRSPEAEQV